MDNNGAWTKDELKEWAKFWNSELGQKYLAKLDLVKMDYMYKAMTEDTAEKMMGMAGRGAGVEVIIEDINALVQSGERTEKEATAKKG